MQFFICFNFHHTENVKYEVYSTTIGFADGQLNRCNKNLIHSPLVTIANEHLHWSKSHRKYCYTLLLQCFYHLSLAATQTFVSTSIFYHPLSKPSSRHPQSPSITAAVFQTCTPPSPGSCSLFNYAVYPQVQDFSLFLFCIPLLSLHLAFSLSSSP